MTPALGAGPAGSLPQVIGGFFLASVASGRPCAPPTARGATEARMYELRRGSPARRSAIGGAGPEQILDEAGWPHAGQVVVVGHQPTLGQVAAMLLGGQSGEVSVRKGAILWFSTREREGREETVLKAVLDPDTLERMEKGGR